MTKSYLAQTQRNTLAWRWMPSCAEGTCPEETRTAWTKMRENVMAHGKKSTLSIHNKLMLYKQYWNLFGPTDYSCGDARNKATLTSFNGFKTRYFGTSLTYLGISETLKVHHKHLVCDKNRAQFYYSNHSQQRKDSA